MNAVGVMLNNLERDRLRAFAVARSHGFTVVHANALPEAWLDGPPRQAYLDAARASGLTVATLFVGFDGQDYSSLATVARTVGLVPRPLRSHRLAVARKYSDLAGELGVPSLSLHLGILPGDDRDLADGLRGLLELCATRGQTVHLETGQESAAELLRFIRHIDRPNLGVNFDPANFLLYGTDEPLTALAALHPLVRGVHCKDGFRPTVPGELGREVPLGQGAVNIPAFLGELLGRGYRGPLVIEREHGPDVVAEILAARAYLQALLERLPPPGG